jgi:hypothetical protein
LVEQLEGVAVAARLAQQRNDVAIRVLGRGDGYRRGVEDVEDAERRVGTRREAERGRSGEWGGREAVEGPETVGAEDSGPCDPLGDPELGSV